MFIVGDRESADIQGPVELASLGGKRGSCHRNWKEMNHMVRVYSISSGRCFVVVFRTIARDFVELRAAPNPTELRSLAGNRIHALNRPSRTAVHANLRSSTPTWYRRHVFPKNPVSTIEKAGTPIWAR